MCYNVAYLTKKINNYAKYLGLDDDVIAEAMEELDQKREVHFVNGFSHPNIPVITNEDQDKMQMFHWGLIPFWTKDILSMSKIIKNTLNARGETIFEKPSFKNSAKKKRCLIVLDAFYEYHHFSGSKYPFRIHHKNNDPLVCAGIWEKTDIEGRTISSVSIVTCDANPLMANIHNNPALKKRNSGPRMPVILPKEFHDKWLIDIDSNDPADIKSIQELIVPYPNDELAAHTAPPLTGNHGVYNSPKASEIFDYPELGLIIGNIIS